MPMNYSVSGTVYIRSSLTKGACRPAVLVFMGRHDNWRHGDGGALCTQACRFDAIEMEGIEEVSMQYMTVV